MKLAKDKKVLRAIAGAAVLSLVVVFWDQVPAARQLEQATLDFRYANFNRDTRASNQVVIIDIDEQSLKLLSSSYGRFPWPRRIYKELLEFLSIGEPAGIFFDLLLTEEMKESNDDRLVADASAANRVTSHAMIFLEDPAEEREGIAPLPADFDERFSLQWSEDPNGGLRQKSRYRDFLLPFPELLAKTPGVHVVSFDKDRDGVYRRARMAFRYGQSWVPSLTLAGVRAKLKGAAFTFHGGSLTMALTAGAEKTIRLDADGTVPLHFHKPDKGPESISLAAVLDSAASLQRGEVTDASQLKVNPLQFEGKILIIGASAAGLQDLKSTPVHSALPGSVLHATAISNLLTGDQLHRAAWPLRIALGLLIVTLTYFSVFFVERIVFKVGIPLALLTLIGVSAILFFHFSSLWFDMALPMFAGLLALLDGLTYVTLVEGREKRKFKGTLAKYLSPSVMEEMLESGNDPRAEVGKRLELSILFSDVQGFTAISERYRAEEVVAILNEYLGQMTNVIFESQGTLDKFIGDAIMAFWGAPIKHDNHALRAVHCALAMQEEMKKLSEIWAAKGQLSLNIGVGINTGEVIVGNIGSEKRLDYTVIGDNVNLASRFEGLTRQYQVPLLVGEKTAELTRTSIIYRELDKVRVKGRANHVKIYEPLCEIGHAMAPAMADLAEKFGLARAVYERQEFEKARQLFSGIDRERKGGDGPSAVYLKRCDELEVDPPGKDWDGTFVARSK